MRTSINALVIGSLLLGSTSLWAQDQTKTMTGPDGRTTIVTWGPAPALPNQGEPDFARLDSNGDGRLSLAECTPHRLLHGDFDYADLNNDGSLTQTELDRWVD